MPVSYTHLDVYKRQILSLNQEEFVQTAFQQLGLPSYLSLIHI